MFTINYQASLLYAWASYINLDRLTQSLLEIYHHELFQLYLPWVYGLVALKIMGKIITAARMRKEGVFVAALFIHGFMSVPPVIPKPTMEQVEVKKTEEEEI